MGVSCAALGANVLLTDVNDMLPLSRANVALNTSILTDAGGSAAVEHLDWSTEEDLARVLLLGGGGGREGTATCTHLTSPGGGGSGGFDFILGESHPLLLPLGLNGHHVLRT